MRGIEDTPMTFHLYLYKVSLGNLLLNLFVLFFVLCFCFVFFLTDAYFLHYIQIYWRQICLSLINNKLLDD